MDRYTHALIEDKRSALDCLAPLQNATDSRALKCTGTMDSRAQKLRA